MLLGLALLAPGCTDPSGDLDTGDATESADGTGGSDPADGSGNVDEGTGSGGADQGEGSGGDPDPAACSEGDEVSAAFEVDDHDWPQAEEFEIDLDVQCEVVDIGEHDGQIVPPTLQCDDDGTMRTVTITMDDPGFTTPDGHPLLPVLDVGQTVRFRHRGVQDAGGLVDDPAPHASHYVLESFSLHSPEGDLLAAGFRSWGMASDMYAPISITENESFCGEPQPFPDDPERPMLVTFELDGASLPLVGGTAGLLDPEGFGDAGIGIVAAVANTGGCCHTNRNYGVLMIALAQGEG